MTDGIEADVIALVQNAVRHKEAVIDLDTSFEQLGIESLDMVELLFAVEEKFGIDVPYNANEVGERGLTTVGDVVSAIRGLMAAKAQAA